MVGPSGGTPRERMPAQRPSDFKGCGPLADLGLCLVLQSIPVMWSEQRAHSRACHIRQGGQPVPSMFVGDSGYLCIRPRCCRAVWTLGRAWQRCEERLVSMG